jgi:hypothetical protein
LEDAGFSFASVAFAQAPIPIYVSSAGASDGFTDPSKDNRDTVKDLRESLADYKTDVKLVDTADEAKIILIVQGRETAQTTAVIGGEGRDRIIRVKVQAGAMTTELTASALGNTITSSGAWGKAAGKIAKQVREWIQTNRAQLAPPK